MRRMKSAALSAALLVAAACANVTQSAPDEIQGSGALRGIDFTSQVAVLESYPVQLAPNVRIVNRRERAVTLEFPNDCIALLRVYDLEGARNAPVWDQQGLPACEAGSRTLELAPSGSTSIRLPTVSAYEILGDSLPDGTYRLTVYLRPNGQVVEAEAGRTELSIPR